MTYSYWIPSNSNVVLLTGVALRFYEGETEKIYRIVRPIYLSRKYSFCTLESCTFHFRTTKRILLGTETVVYSLWKGSTIVKRRADCVSEVPRRVDELIRKTYELLKMSNNLTAME